MSHRLAILVVCVLVGRVSAGPAEDLDAARAAEREGRYAQAVELLERVARDTTDERTRVRVRGDIARLSVLASPLAVDHTRLVEQLQRGGDPRSALRALEALVSANPSYAGATSVMLSIAQGWEREGEMERALDWLRRASRSGELRTQAELARALLRARRLEEARSVIATIQDPVVTTSLRRQIATVEWRERVRWGVRAALALLAVLALVALHRVGWRRLRRVPIEVLYYAPIAGLLAVVAQTGNPLVARSVQLISMAGLVVAWICGTLLDVKRRWHHVIGAVAAMGCIGYLVIDHEHLIDLLLETWRNGPAMR